MKLKLKKGEQKVGVHGETGASRGTFMNKLGAGGFTIWLQIIFILVVTIFAVELMYSQMDSYYGTTSHNLEIFDNATQEHIKSLENLSISGTGFVSGGEVTTSFWGFNWKPAWTIISTLFSLIYSIIVGPTIPNTLSIVFRGAPGIYAIGQLMQGVLIVFILLAIVAIVTKVRNP